MVGIEEQIDLPPITKEPLRYPNLDSNLNRLVEESPAIRRAENADGGASGQDAELILVTFYIEPERVADVLQHLEDNGIFVRNVGEDYIEAHVPQSLLGAASEQPGVLRVDTVIPSQPAQSQGRVISQGVGLHGADSWHNAGYRGNSVRVGVIDSGFEGFSRLQGANELPSRVTARCYFEGPRQPSSSLADCETGNEHGTAVAETLIDVAPEVELYIANPRTNGDLRNAVDWMAGEGVKVINYSVGKVVDGPGDGTSPFSDSPLWTIDAAVAGGTIWVTAGGNSAQEVWYGTFSDLDNNGIHNFAPRDEGNTFRMREGDQPVFFMRWDDDWGRADCDLDLVLTRSVSGENIIQFAADEEQDGSNGSYPRAIIARTAEVTAEEAGLYALWIDKYTCADDPAWIQLTAWIDGDLQYFSSGRHMGNPEESRNPGMMAVGAAHYSNTDSIASYSSRGPTIDGRTKPDITGVACGRSTIISPVPVDGHQCWFPGTSQSASHVAGLAALVRQRFPDYSPAQTVRYLQDNAVDRGQTRPDNTWGHGLAALPTVQPEPTPTVVSPTPTAAPTPTLTPTPTPDVVAPTTDIIVRDGTNPGEVIVSFDAVPDATHYRIGYVNMETDYPLAKGSTTGDWINAFVYVDEDARNLQVSNGRAEYTVRRLTQGVRHAFTVLASGDVVNNREYLEGRYLWPSSPRWQFHTVGR